MAISSVTLQEISGRSENGLAKVDSLPIAVAERLEAVASDKRVESDESTSPAEEALPRDNGSFAEPDGSFAEPDGSFAESDGSFAESDGLFAESASVATSTREPPDHVAESPSAATALDDELTGNVEHATSAATSFTEPTRPVEDSPSVAASFTEPADRVDDSSLQATAAFAGEARGPVDGSPSPSAAFTGEPAGRDEAPSGRPLVDQPLYTERRRSRASAFLLVAVLVAGVGAIYWLAVSPTHPPATETGTRGESTIAPAAPSGAPASTSPSANTAIELGGKQPPPKAAPPKGSADSPGPPAVAGEPASSSAKATPPTPAQTPESAAAQSPTPDTPPSAAGGRAKTSKAPATDDTRGRTVAPQRSKEQAERDASATQRLIERELGDSQRTDSNHKPPAQ